MDLMEVLDNEIQTGLCCGQIGRRMITCKNSYAPLQAPPPGQRIRMQLADGRVVWVEQIGESQETLPFYNCACAAWASANSWHKLRLTLHFDTPAWLHPTWSTLFGPSLLYVLNLLGGFLVM